MRRQGVGGDGRGRGARARPPDRERPHRRSRADRCRAAPFDVIAGGHPLPTVESERAGRRALALAESVQPGERLLCLLSGGASALMAVPAAGVSLEDKQATTSRSAAGGGGHHGPELRPEAPVRDQGRRPCASIGVGMPHARHLGRRGRRPRRDRIGSRRPGRELVTPMRSTRCGNSAGSTRTPRPSSSGCGPASAATCRRRSSRPTRAPPGPPRR